MDDRTDDAMEDIFEKGDEVYITEGRHAGSSGVIVAESARRACVGLRNGKNAHIPPSSLARGMKEKGLGNKPMTSHFLSMLQKAIKEESENENESDSILATCASCIEELYNHSKSARCST